MDHSISTHSNATAAAAAAAAAPNSNDEDDWGTFATAPSAPGRSVMIPPHLTERPQQGSALPPSGSADLLSFSPTDSSHTSTASNNADAQRRTAAPTEDLFGPEWEASLHLPPPPDADENTIDAFARATRARKHASTSPSAHRKTDSWGSFRGPGEGDAEADAFSPVRAQHRALPPPMIDLRDVERRLAAGKSTMGASKESSSSRPSTNPADEDFFAAFERAPAERMGSMGKGHQLAGEQLDMMADAQKSPMGIPEVSSMPGDYFGGANGTHQIPAARGASPRPIGGRTESPSALSPGNVSGGAGGSWADSAGGWTGSLRKTWSTIRASSGDLASAFIAPADDAVTTPGSSALGVNQPSTSEHRRGSGASAGSGAGSGGPGQNGRKQSLARAADYAHGTPFGAGGGSSFATSPSTTLSHSHPSLASSSAASHRSAFGPQPSVPISGAPGFDASSTRRWNTGSWALPSSEASLTGARRAMPVRLSGRREETEVVCEGWHAARVRAALPPRLQLGKTWRMLYSADQHGISLGTLYANVARAFDPSRASRSSGGGPGSPTSPRHSAGEDDGPEGWLRGASSAARSAVGAGGGGVRGLGAGLALSEAGLVIAVRDAEDNIFGAFINEKVRPQSSYYGNGECFLWKTIRAPKGSSQEATEDDEDADAASHAGESIETYRWTGRNDYMVLTEAHYFSVGGGEGRYGLWLDAALERGVSSPCPAFDNAVLCDDVAKSAGQPGDVAEGSFDCMGLEVWAVGLD